MRKFALLAAALSLTLAGASLPAQAQAGPALDFSTEADETGDPFAGSVEARYAGGASRAEALADLRAAGMTCSEAGVCSKVVRANDCTYTFVVRVIGTADQAVVAGRTELRC